ncbi:MAG: hypothetical protein MUE61_15970 [Vicinamibacterales bacterium]|nr:hypothetical protein [Vicinamibacterales bacterium]
MRYTPDTMRHEAPHARRRVPALARLAGITAALAVLGGALAWPAEAQTRVKAAARPGAAPPWNKGMIPVNSESYYHAIECGKQGGDDPACVFWDTGLCKNDDFTLTFYSGYKQVAYEVWTAVRKKKPAPQPSYQAAQRTRITIGVTPAAGSKNALTDFVVKRGGKPVPPAVRTVSGGAGNFTFDYAAFAPTAAVTLDMVGTTRTVSCVISPEVLRQFR